jgi:hypothetical protein
MSNSSYVPGTVVTFALTTGDIGQAAVFENLLLRDVNIHVYAADVYYGSGIMISTATQSSATPTAGIIRANAVVWFQDCYIQTMFFKSFVASTPGYVVIVGTVA